MKTNRKLYKLYKIGQKCLTNRALGFLGAKVGQGWKTKSNFDEEVTSTTPFQGPRGNLFGTFSSFGRPWDLKMVVWILFDTGFEIKV